MPNGNHYRIVVLGDSIQWGQGLPEEWKFSELVRQTIERELRRPANLMHRFAHSGAVIGDRGDPAAPNNFDPGRFTGELPARWSSIHGQLTALMNDREINRDDIDLVLVDGGINDIGIGIIIDPRTEDGDLQDRARQACFGQMVGLLQRITVAFPNARVVVTGYYPIFSPLSSTLLAIPWFMGLEIIFPVSFLIGSALILRLSQLSELWGETSSLALRDSVNAVNNILGQRRVVYAHVPFGPENCLFAPESWLFGLTPVLTPEDPVVQERIRLCGAATRAQDPICLWASVGHPNRQGSWQYFRAIIRALREIGVLAPPGLLERVCTWAQDQEFRCLQWRENRRTVCATDEAAEIVQCNAAHTQRLNVCNTIQCNAFTNCNQIQCNAFTNCNQIQCNAFGNCAWWDVPCHTARAACVFAAAIERAACWVGRVACVAVAVTAQAACWVARGACIAAAAIARALCIANSLVILASCIMAARARRDACVIGTEIVYRSCQALTWLVKKVTCW